MEVKSITEIDSIIGKAFKTNKEIALEQLQEIILRMPVEIRNLIEEAFKFQRIPKEYLLSSILYAFSNAAGLAFSINCLGYTNYSNLYFAIIGSRGDQKSPAMDLATRPLVKHDDNMYEEFKNQMLEYDPESKKPIRKQLLLQDATIEAAIYCHHKNRYSIGIFVDELYFLIEKMASKNSPEGAAWRVFFLQGNTNKHIDVSRKTTESYRIEKSYPTLLGSIQNQFVKKLFADGNLESGLIDRILFTSKLTSNNIFTTDTMSSSVISDYEIAVTNLLEFRTSIEDSVDINEIQIELCPEAENLIFNYSQDLIYRQNSSVDLTKEYISKMLINIHKITLLLHLIENASTSSCSNKITKETVETAILILEFYFTNFKIVLEENIVEQNKLPCLEDVIRLAMKNKATQSDVVAITGLHKSTVSRNWNKLLNN